MENITELHVQLRVSVSRGSDTEQRILQCSVSNEFLEIRSFPGICLLVDVVDVWIYVKQYICTHAQNVTMIVFFNEHFSDD